MASSQVVQFPFLPYRLSWKAGLEKLPITNVGDLFPLNRRAQSQIDRILLPELRKFWWKQNTPINFPTCPPATFFNFSHHPLHSRSSYASEWMAV